MSKSEMIVTQAQYQEGFYVRGRAGMVISLPYQLVRRLPDGNYLVKVPDVLIHPQVHGNIELLGGRKPA